MKILYIDLNESEEAQQISLNQKQYGIGRILAGFSEYKDNIYLAARKESFFNEYGLIPSNNERILFISLEQIKNLANRASAKEIIPFIDNFDIVIHNRVQVSLNLQGTKCKEAAWSVGFYEDVNSNLSNLLLYNDYQRPKLTHNVNIYKFILGGFNNREFKENQKEDFIFQCGRHIPAFNSYAIANFCLQNGIKGIFAGQLKEDYPLLKLIDNKTTFFLGEISEKEKIDLNSKARLATIIHSGWPTPFSLAAVEALSNGTPVAVATNNLGFWPTLIKEGINGFYISDYITLKEAWNNAPKLNQKDCFDSIKEFTYENMFKSLYEACEKICAA